MENTRFLLKKLVFILLLQMFAPLVYSQSFNLISHNAIIYDSTFARNNWAAPNPIVDIQVCDSSIGSPLVLGGLGSQYGITCGRQAYVHNLPEIRTRGTARTTFTLNGADSTEMEIFWDNFVTSYNFSVPNSPYHAAAKGVSSLAVELDIQGVANGTPITIYYTYEGYSGHGANPENGTEDTASVRNSLTINGTEVFLDDGHQMNFSAPPPNSEFIRALDGGQFIVNAGTIFTIDIATSVFCDIDPVGRRFVNFEKDRSTADAYGKLKLSLNPISTPPSHTINQSNNEIALFSLDIGSASEISDPNPNGTEYFDPGDAYEFNGATMGFGGADGSIDDITYLGGTDLFPNPPDANNPPVTGAPLFSGVLDPIAFADMDGLDMLDTNDPINFSSLQAQHNCVYPLEYIFLSFDDDTIGNYSNSMVSVPAASNSSNSGLMYGTSQNKDEIVEYRFSRLAPQAPIAEIGVYDEESIHQSLAPNPTFNPDPFVQNLEDDDVDALDFSEGYTNCPFVYVSVDHEATGQNTANGNIYDPGIIYLIQGGALTPILTHPDLGILQGTDINAFEFVLYPDSLAPFASFKLALLFSVDDDDPSTIEDESGGLASNMLYVSFMNGNHFPLDSNYIFDDNIDAIGSWDHSLDGTVYTGVINSIFNNNILVEHITVYPNPAKEFLNFNISDQFFNKQDDVLYLIINSVGQIVQSGNLKHGQKRVKLNEMAKGWYQIVLYQSGDFKQSSFIKE